MTLHAPERPNWTRTPTRLAVLTQLTKGQKVARTALWTHRFGWEIRLTVDGDLSESTVCHTEEQVFTTSAHWKARLTEKGWA